MKMKKFALFMFQLTCKEASPLISEMMDHRVSLWTRLRVKIHLAMCKFCGYYRRQLETLGVLAADLGAEDSPATANIPMPPETKRKIQQMLDSES